MNKKVVTIGMLIFVNTYAFSQKYLYQIKTPADIRKEDDYLIIGSNHWYHDTCLYNRHAICKENTSSSTRIKVYDINNISYANVLIVNNTGYLSEHPYDSFCYVINQTNIDSSFFTRSVIIHDKVLDRRQYKLNVIDTLFYKESIPNKIFDKKETNKKVKIIVFQSKDHFGNISTHFWVENIGILKLASEKDFNYSFELNDIRTKKINKYIISILKFIKKKYPDPYWLIN
jgi:hypothetical protein